MRSVGIITFKSIPARSKVMVLFITPSYKLQTVPIKMILNFIGKTVVKFNSNIRKGKPILISKKVWGRRVKAICSTRFNPDSSNWLRSQRTSSQADLFLTCEHGAIGSCTIREGKRLEENQKPN